MLAGLFTLRPRLRRVAYSFSLGLLYGFGLGLIVGGLLSPSRLSLITSLFSLLLLQLTHLPLSFLIASCGFGVKPVYFLFACVIHLLRFLPLVLNLEPLISALVGNTFHAH